MLAVHVKAIQPKLLVLLLFKKWVLLYNIGNELQFFSLIPLQGKGIAIFVFSDDLLARKHWNFSIAVTHYGGNEYKIF
ncbi:hypothetical protein D3C86_1356130 [compost metagenome]